MSVRNGLKGLLCLALAACLGGCASSSQSEDISILCPTGAPALATLGLEDTNSVEYVEGTDLLVSELSKTDGDYDMIIAPVNVGVKAWKEAGTYELAAILTWGNLYIVSEEEDWDTEGNTLLAFGEGAVPGLVLNNLYPDLNCEVSWYPSVAETSQALLAGSDTTALLAQPVAAGTISKGQDAGKNLNIVTDIQQVWQDTHHTDRKGYPQAALFVKKGKEDACKEAMSQMETFLEDPDADQIEAKVDALSADRLGVPSAKLAAATWDAQNIHYVSAADAKSDLEQFLSVFGMDIPDGLIAE